MYLLGYSLNNLSLMALTIATGFVVDDAIVMIENIARYIEEGEPPLQAALKGATQIGFTIISLTVSLIAVLIPLLFMGDVVGRLFREFAVTLAITILISAVVSLTLVPMMSARWLQAQPRTRSRARRRALQRFFDRVMRALRRLAAAGCSTTRRITLLVALAHVRADRGAVPGDSEGPVPDAGHRPAAGAHRGRAGRLVRAHGASCSRQAARAILARPGRRQPELRSSASTRANNTMLHTGSMLINLQAERTATSRRSMDRLRERVRAGAPA